MAVDKAIDSTEFDSKLTTVANAIREKSGKTASMSFPSGMIEAITAIETGGEYIIKHGSRTFTENTFPYTAPVVIEHGLGKAPLFFIGVSGTRAYNAGGAIAYIVATDREILPRRLYQNFYCYSSVAGTFYMQLVYDSDSYKYVTMNDTSVTIISNYPAHGFYFSGSNPAVLNWWAVGRK